MRTVAKIIAIIFALGYLGLRAYLFVKDLNNEPPANYREQRRGVGY